MLHTGYRYEVQKRDRLMVLVLLGEIDHHNAAELRGELDAFLLRERPARLVMDLSKVAFMDSSGLGLLLGRMRLVKTFGGVMAVKCTNPRILKILRLSGMERFMEIEGSGQKEK